MDPSKIAEAIGRAFDAGYALAANDAYAETVSAPDRFAAARSATVIAELADLVPEHPPPPTAPPPAAPPRAEIYTHEECVFAYCPDPDVCRASSDGCVSRVRSEGERT